jgi:hypothetical protein
MAFTLSPALSTQSMGVRTNMVSWQHNCVTDTIPRSVGGQDWIYQYTAWYNLQPHNSNVHLAYRRRLASSDPHDPNAWQTPVVQAADSGLNGGISGDSHFAISIGVDLSGRVHVWWRAHNADAVMYWRGTGPGDIHVDDNDPSDLPAIAIPDPPTKPSGSSYWRPFNNTSGVLYATFRVGAPGQNAQQALIVWDDEAATWSVVSAAIIDWPGSGGDQESPYMQRVYVNPLTNRWHWAWIWARGGAPETHHGWSYIYSDDDGVTWHAADGTLMALPVGGLATHPASILYDQPEDSAMPVHGGLTAFDDDQPILLYTARDDENPDEDTALYVLSYYQGQKIRNRIRVVAEDWLYIDDPEAGAADQEVGRFDLVPDGTSVHALYRSQFEPNGVRVTSCHTAALDDWTDPVTLIDVTTFDPEIDLAYNEITHDERAWAAFRVLQGYIQGSDLGKNYLWTGTGLPPKPNFSAETTAFVNIMRPAPGLFSFADFGAFAMTADVTIMRPAPALISFSAVEVLSFVLANRGRIARADAKVRRAIARAKARLIKS